MLDKVLNLESFLLEKFVKLPLWVRVSTYIVLLLLYIYLTIQPSFIWGECLIKESDGGMIPFRGGVIHYVLDGRVIKCQINEEGLWSVPVISKLPGTMELYFLNDAGKKWPISIKTTPWTTGNHKILYSEVPEGFSIAEKEASSLVSFITEISKKVIDVLSPHLAFAQDETAMNTDIEKRVRSTVSKVLGVDSMEIIQTTSIQRSATISQIKRIKLVIALQNEFKISISDEEWHLIYTVGDAIALVHQKVK